MKKNYIIRSILLFWMIAYTLIVEAQDHRPAVLHIFGNSNYQTHFDTQTRFTTDAIERGQKGEATIEFWIMAGPSDTNPNNAFSPWSITNLLTGSDAFSFLGSRDELTLTLGNAVTNITLTPSQRLLNNQWNHFAITLDAQNQLRIYLDGVELQVIQNVTMRPEHLYMSIAANNDLMLAEYRVWSRVRTRAQIENTRFRSLFNENESSIAEFRGLGLVIGYTNSEFTEATFANLPRLASTVWDNIAATIDNGFVQQSRITSDYREIRRFAEIRTDADHPIFSLDRILLRAADGGGIDDDVENDTRGILLRWPHIANVDSYTIRRRAVNGGATSSVIETVDDVANRMVSSFITYYDTSIIPGELYEYTVEAFNGGAMTSSGSDTGFVFHNGEIDGSVITNTQTAVPNVKIEAVLTNDGNAVARTDQSLLFTNGAVPVVVNNIEPFRESRGFATIEFWYKTPSTNTASNTVFKLDAGEIRMTDTKAEMYLGSNVYVSADKPNDTNWHHYAFTVSPTGGALYIDGGVQPIGANTEITPNATTVNPFAINLNRTSQFSFNHQINNPYHIDELRIWSGIREATDIFNYREVILGDNEEDLIAYYRFDINGESEIYNQAIHTRGILTGRSFRIVMVGGEERVEEVPLTFANDRPAINYASFTDQNGMYSFRTLPGITGGNTSLRYTFTPVLPNHTFSPVDRSQQVPLALIFTDAQRNLEQFIDTSTFTVTGEVVYRVPNVSAVGGFDLFPVVTNTPIVLDGQIIRNEDGTVRGTNMNGTYSFSAPLGRHTFSIHPQLIQDEAANSNQAVVIDESSLDFNGNTSYAVSSEMVSANAAEQFTWSFFYSPDDVADPNIIIPEVQTLLHWGDLLVNLQANNRIHVFIGEQEITQREIESRSDYNFFAISYNGETNQVRIQLDAMPSIVANVPSGTKNFNTNLYLGAQNRDMTQEAFSRANIDIVEYRDAAYSESQLIAIREGEVITLDEDHLQLSYTFEQEAESFRALNTIVGATNENNYLNLENEADIVRGGSGYIREIAFDYVPTNAEFNPAEGMREYVLNVVDPISSLNFENRTRYNFIGNIVVPCDNNVGVWTGTITRSDIREPQFIKTIEASNFNAEQNVFVVKDLLPGNYEVSVTNTMTGFTLPTFSVNLQQGNVIRDIRFRNPIEQITEFYRYDITNQTLLTAEGIATEDLAVARIDPLCNRFYALEAGQEVLASVRVFEQYGVAGNEETQCVIEDVKVSLSGDVILGAGGRNLEMTTNEVGRANFVFQVSTPNFLGNNTRGLNIAVQRGEGANVESINANESVYVTGAEPAATDFTLTNPQVGYVLHDPPGDGSSATLEQGATYSNSYSFEEGTDIMTAFTAGVGVEFDVEMTTAAVTAPLGVGTVQGVNTTVSSNELNVGTTTTANFSYRNTGGNGTSVSLTQNVSTPTFDTYVGQDADVYIGTSDVLGFSMSRALTVNEATCTAVVNPNQLTMVISESTPFAFTQQQLLDVTIPSLQQLLIGEIDGVNSPNQSELDLRNSNDLSATLDRILTQNLKDEDETIRDLAHQIDTWTAIIQKNREKLKEVNFLANGETFANTTESLETLGGVGSVSALDQELSFSSGVNVSYALSRAVTNDDGSVNGGGVVTGINIGTSFNALGVRISLSNETSISGVRSNASNNSNGSSRVDSFTFTDDDAGDQFNVSIRRDPEYDTPMFLTRAGRSMCPYESGTVPRQGVEIVLDRTVGFSTPGDDSILYNVILRNTQRAQDNTRKTYIVGLNGASNNQGAQVFFNESPIFEPATTSPITFGLDGNSPTGVVEEIVGQLRITRGLDAPENISYEDIGIRFFAACEQDGDVYRRYRVDEYAEVGVVPFQEVFVSAHFSGACVEEIEQAAPLVDWVVNNASDNELQFRFAIPGLNDFLGVAPAAEEAETSTFQVRLEYANEGNNTPVELVTLDAATLRANLDDQTGFVVYDADVSGLANGTYSMRITPICDPDSLNPNSRNNPTAFVEGVINRTAAERISTNPVNNGVLTEGAISITFNGPINTATVNLNSIGLRGVIGGLPRDLVSAELAQNADEISVPHQPVFNIEGAFTVEMWVNPSRYPTMETVPMLRKGSNYGLALLPNGTIRVNDVLTTNRAVLPFEWTHIAAVYDGRSTVEIYFNGESVASAPYNGVVSNNEAIEISPDVNGESYIGRLDDIRIWNVAKSPLEINTQLNRQLLGNESGLIAYFILDDIALAGVNGAQDEAIRDFTGNAIGTTATGLAFVNGEAEAAPLDVTRRVTDLQFTTTVSDGGTTININPLFTVADLEGARLTAMIHENRLRDQAENMIDGYSWSFIVNQNTIAWSQNNINRSQVQGQELIIDDIDLINEAGGVPVTYRFEQLPVWLSVQERNGSTITPIAEGANRRIEALETERDLEFVVAPYLNPGVHTANVAIVVENANSGQSLGVETFTLEITTNCEVPNYTAGFSSGDFLGTMNFVGRLMINDAQSIDTNDIVAVYLNDEFRGSGQVGVDGMVRFGVFGDDTETGTLSFRVWDASECTEYGSIIEHYNFAFGSIQGTIAIPVTFTVGENLTRRIPVTGRFYEVSFNLIDNTVANTLSLSSIRGLSNGDQLADAASPSTIIATVDANGVLIGIDPAMTTIDIRKGYLLRRIESTSITLEVSGIPVPVDTNIAIAGGNVRTGIAFLPDQLQTTSLALRSLTSTIARAGDFIERRGLSAEYDDVNGWVGTLTHLTPGLGYITTLNVAGTLNYSGIASRANTSGAAFDVTTNEVSYLEKASRLDWRMDTGNYAEFMYMTAVLKTTQLDVTKDYIIAAFIGDEVRGIAKPQLVNNQYHYFIGIGADENAEVIFKLYDGEKIITLDNVETFDSNVLLGGLKTPYELNYTAKNNTVEQVIINDKIGFSLTQNIPNPMTDTTRITYSVPEAQHVDISLYNLLGQKVYTFVNEKVSGNTIHTIDWNGEIEGKVLANGIYIYQLTAGEQVLQHKLIIE
ncbi:LamG-like jellyroll fold domain-containing protein [Aquimarina rhabdastrellae]